MTGELRHPTIQECLDRTGMAPSYWYGMTAQWVRLALSFAYEGEWGMALEWVRIAHDRYGLFIAQAFERPGLDVRLTQA